MFLGQCWQKFAISMKLLEFVKIELEKSVIHQNKAEFMQKFTSWQKSMPFVIESWLFKGGLNFTPPQALVYKKYVGPRRVKIIDELWVTFVVNRSLCFASRVTLWKIRPILIQYEEKNQLKYKLIDLFLIRNTYNTYN